MGIVAMALLASNSAQAACIPGSAHDFYGDKRANNYPFSANTVEICEQKYVSEENDLQVSSIWPSFAKPSSTGVSLLSWCLFRDVCLSPLKIRPDNSCLDLMARY
jgi:hypothetical protein